MDLRAFLLARIAEDEVAARELFVPMGAWRTRRNDVDLVWDVNCESWGHVVTTGYVGNADSGPVADHIARHDPVRVLAECDAKRRIVEAEPERWVRQPDAPATTLDMATPEGMVRVYGKLISETEYRDRYMELAPPSQTLLYLSIPYSDHPDYQPEWAEAVQAAA